MVERIDVMIIPMTDKSPTREGVYFCFQKGMNSWDDLELVDLFFEKESKFWCILTRDGEITEIDRTDYLWSPNLSFPVIKKYIKKQRK